jgi:superfamily II DNA or RNA helicase
VSYKASVKEHLFYASEPMALRDYQIKIKQDINDLWEAGQAHVMAVMPTGAGKTVTMASLCGDVGEPTLAIAHRQELVGQISLAFARQGLTHRIIAPAATVRAITEQHVEEVGRNWVRPNADIGVAGIDTLIKREDEFFDRVTFWQLDESHHALEANKWGKGIAKLRNATRGTGWTATPLRTDKKALKRGQGGIFDALAVGPSMRDLIDRVETPKMQLQRDILRTR